MTGDTSASREVLLFFHHSENIQAPLNGKRDKI